MMASESFTSAELFCGGGGFRAGQPDNWRTLWAIDNDKNSIATYTANSGDVGVILADVREIDFGEMASPDLLLFGFPCNDFSLGNSEMQSKSPSEIMVQGQFAPLYRECVRALEVLQPAMFLAENVPGLTRGGMASMIATEFAESGYRVSMALLSANDYGAPQKRKRLIFGGIRNDLNRFWQAPAPTYLPLPKNGEIRLWQSDSDTNIGFDDYRTAGMAIGDMSGCSEANNHRIYPPSKQCQKAWRYTDVGSHPPQELMQRHNLNSGFKLAPNMLSPTIVACSPSLIWHWAELRELTAREAARLQTFPDDWVFVGGRRSVWSQIGMAVPPVLARALYLSAEVVIASNADWTRT